MDKERLAVGDSTRLEIIFDTKSGRTRVSKRPKIYIQGSDLPRSVQITAHVLPRPDSAYPITLKPYKLDISQFGEKKRTKAEFTVNNVSKTDLEIKVIDFQDQYFDVNFGPTTIKAGESAKGKVTINSDRVDQSFEKSVTFLVTGKGQTKPVRFTLPIKRTVRKLSSTLDSTMTATGKGGGS